MKSILILCLVMLQAACGIGQRADIIQPIKQLFDGMRQGDQQLIAAAFVEDAVLETFIKKEDGQISRRSTEASEFIASAGQPHEEVWNEVIWNYDVRQDGPLATVWTEYTFYVGSR